MQRFLLLAGTLGIALAFCQASVAQSSGDFHEAVGLMKSGRFAEARPMLERIVQRTPGDLDARNNLAVCLIMAKNFDEAEKHLQFVIAIAPKRAGSLLNLGVAKQGRNSTDDALANNAKALDLLRSQGAMKVKLFAAALFNRGWLLDEKNKLDGAIQSYKEAIALQPRYAKAWIGLAVAYGKKGLLDDARDALDQAAKFHGGDQSLISRIEQNRKVLQSLNPSGKEPTKSPDPEPKKGEPTPEEAEPAPGLLSHGLFGWALRFLPLLASILVYAAAHLLLFVIYYRKFVNRRRAIEDKDKFIGFVVFALAGALLFVVGWGYARWFLGILAAIATGLLAAFLMDLKE